MEFLDPDELSSLFPRLCFRIRTDLSCSLLSGADRFDFIDRLSTNKVSHLELGTGVHTIFTSDKGRCIDSALLAETQLGTLLIRSTCYSEVLLSWLKKFIIMDDVRLSSLKEKTVSEVSGADAFRFISESLGADVSTLEIGHSCSVNLVDGTLLIIRIPSNCELSYLLISSQNIQAGILDNLLSNKAIQLPHNQAEIQRILHLRPIAPNEINDSYNPLELGLINFVSFKKGCYIGQEVIARLDSFNKVQRRIVMLSSTIEPQSSAHVLIKSEDKSIGSITSVASLRKDFFLSLALIRHEYAVEGSSFLIEGEKLISAKSHVHSFQAVK